MVYMSGMIKENTKGIGQQIRYMAEEYTHGARDVSMKDNTNMIKNMALDVIRGPMEESIQENGEIIRDMGKEKSYRYKAIRDKAFGRMIKE